MSNPVGNISHADFTPLVSRALLLPVAVIVVFAIALAGQIQVLLEAAALVEHTDQVIAETNALEKLHVDLETGLRGYLLNNDESFLSPYNAALPQLAGGYRELEQRFAKNPRQLARLQEIRELKDAWLEYSILRLQQRKEPDFVVDLDVARDGKQKMDSIRAGFEDMLADEAALRDERSQAARRGVRYMLITLGICAVVAALVLMWLTHRSLSKLAASYQAALRTADELTEHLEQRVEQRTRQLADANAELEAFSYSVSHDLRAPMRHISGFSHMLQKSLDDKLSADDRENLAIIADTSKQAGLMVDALLAFSRVGRTELNLGDVDTAALVAEIRRSLEMETKDRTIEWKIGTLPIVRADAALLRLVFQNLLANAVKYTIGAAPAVIEVGHFSEPDVFRFFVRDNGVGFDMQYVDKLFGVFQRLHRSEDFEGTGIGLANVRRIVVRHGGTVAAEGALGRGATFYFTLPKAPQIANV